MRLIYGFLFLAVFIGCILGQSHHGARAQGLGGAYTALSNDPTTLNWNPAGLSLFPQNAFVTNWTALFVGFSDDNIGTGSLGYIHHLPYSLSTGISADILYSDMFTRNIIGLSMSRPVGKHFALGVRGNFITSSFNSNNFFYTDADYRADPVFITHGYKQNSYGLDAGFVASPLRGLTFGFYGMNLIEPDIALSTLDSKMPQVFRFGTAYTFRDKYSLSVEGVYDTDAVNDEDFKYAVGAETWQYNRTVGFRGGYNPDNLSFGASYRNPSLAFFGIDYTFIYPLTDLGAENATTHKLSLSLGYYHERVPKEPKVVVVPTPPPPPPTSSVTFTPQNLNIMQVTRVTEKEPLVPLVFFDAGSAVVAERYNPMIETVGKRLARNPAVQLNLAGYFDPRSEANDDQLHIKRADAVRSRFAELVPGSERNIAIVRDGYGIDEPRAGIGRDVPDAEEQEMVNHENRRVAFTAVPIGDAKREMNIATQAEQNASILRNIFANNPDIDALVDGGETIADMREALAYKEDLLKFIPQEYESRLFVSIGGIKGQININPDGIIFAPSRSKRTFEIIRENMDISLDISGDIERYSLEIIDDKGEVFAEIESGIGTPPEALRWFWRDRMGELPDTDKRYQLKFEATDTLGRATSAISDERLNISVSHSQELEAGEFIIQFAYDEDRAQVPYLESRLEMVAREIIEKAAKTEHEIDVRILGHSSILGSVERNVELSEERATKEYENIRKYLKAILNLNTDDELDKWLKRQNVNIIIKGLGSEVPYRIYRWERSRWQDILIGNNALPEGRTINRRVVIEVGE